MKKNSLTGNRLLDADTSLTDEDAMDSDLVRALLLRGVDVTTALDAGFTSATDEEHLKFAIASERRLYSFNVSDFMALHTSYLAAGKPHAGIILAQQQRYSDN